MQKQKVLFVCLGNICRSPTAEGVFNSLIKSEALEHFISCDSCGTSSYHIGEAPDPRSQLAAKKRGIDLSQIRSRQLHQQDYYEFNYILAMDENNLSHILEDKPSNAEAKISRFLAYSKNFEELSVPDPYWNGPNGFELVLDMIEDAAKGLLSEIRKEKL